MTSRLKDLFEECPDVESFEKSVKKLEGDFSFDKCEMLSLGLAYFEKYPDRKENRNSDEVRIGYRIARICITENLIRGFSENEKDSLRKGFKNLKALADTAKIVTAARDRKETEEFHQILTCRLEGIQKTVNSLPKGMIRERFTGAISTSSNFLYLFKVMLEESQNKP